MSFYFAIDSVLSYEFHIMFNCLMRMSLVVLLLFHERKQKFLQTVLVQEDAEETVTLLRENEIFFFFCSSLCKASAEQTHQKAAE